MIQSYEEYGNTSTATLPFTICNNVDEIKKKERVRFYMCGYGVGLAWSSVVLDMDTTHIYPIEETDFFYED